MIDKPMKQGDQVELLTTYFETYEDVRERKVSTCAWANAHSLGQFTLITSVSAKINHEGLWQEELGGRLER